MWLQMRACSEFDSCWKLLWLCAWEQKHTKLFIKSALLSPRVTVMQEASLWSLKYGGKTATGATAVVLPMCCLQPCKLSVCIRLWWLSAVGSGLYPSRTSFCLLSLCEGACACPGGFERAVLSPPIPDTCSYKSPGWTSRGTHQKRI